MHSKLKWLYKPDKRRDEKGVSQRQEEKVEKQSKLDRLFPQSASDSSVWVTVPLSLCSSTSLALPDYLFAGEEEWGSGAERGGD